MPIPFILGGVALAAGAFGAKKAYDGHCDKEEADRLIKEAKEIYENAERSLIDTRNNCNLAFEELGRLKINVFTKNIKRWKNTVDKIRNKPMKELDTKTENFVMTSSVFKEIEQTIISFSEIASGGIASLGAGALTGIGAYGSVSLFATASTGTAISSLSGAVATNATLAWFGGGALYAGGLGMAGGLAILGGITAAPVLALGGFLYSKKAKEALDNATSDYCEVLEKVEEMKTAKATAKGIENILKQIIKELNRLNGQFIQIIVKLEYLVKQETDYHKFSDEQLSLFNLSSNMFKVIYDLCKVDVLSEDGEVSREIKQYLDQARKFNTKK